MKCCGYGGNEGDGDENHVIKTFTSNINGRTFRIVDQTSITGWSGRCDLGAQMIVISGYNEDKKISELISDANSYYLRGGVMSNTYLDGHGFTKKEVSVSTLGDSEKVAEQLINGGYIIVRLEGIRFTGKSGTVWNKSGHWVSIIGYRNENNKEQFYVGTTGTGKCGWYDLDEFSAKQRGIVTVVVFVNHN